MNLPAPRFGFPLLAKELVELSARRRTYLVRVVYAIALYGVTLWTYWRWLGQFEADSFELLGRGQTLFDELQRWQFWGLYLFLPVVTASAITSEKERDTLPLLLLTKLGSWTILLEKLFSRLVAMGSFLLLGLPLAAVAYSLGGVEIESILKAAYVLSVTSLQVASFALLCSTWFRTTSSAFVGTYLLGIVGVLFGSELLKLALGVGIAFGAHKLPWPGLTDEGREWFVNSVSNNPTYRPLYGPWLLQTDPLGTEHVARMLGLIREPEYLPVEYLISNSRTSSRSMNISTTTSLLWNMSQSSPQFGSSVLWLGPTTFGGGFGTADRTTLTECLACSLPLLGSALVFLILARVFLWRRMKVPETSWLARLFVVGDRCFQVLNRNPITRGMVFGSARDDLPVEKPIAWRETRKRSLGTAQHLIRLLLLLEVPLLGWIGWRLWTWQGAGSLTLALGALGPLWILTILIVTVQSTGLIAAEKSRQTLDVLLTTPLASRDIALQKLAGLRRLMLVLAVPLLTVFIAETAWNVVASSRAEIGLVDYELELSGSRRVTGRVVNQRGQTESQFDIELPQMDDLPSTAADSFEAALGLIGQILGVLVYLPLLGWIGFQWGLRLRTQTQAIWATLITVGLICAGPSLAVRGIEAAQAWWFPASAVLSQSEQFDDLQVFHSGFIEEGVHQAVIVPPRPAWLIGLGWLSPLRVLFSDSFPRDYGELPHVVWFLLLFHFAVLVGTLCLLRRNALANFGRWLRRAEAVTGWRASARTSDFRSGERQPPGSLDSTNIPS